jgi:O-antigen ligase
LLVALGVAGMFWADVSWSERLHGIDSFFKLLMIPLLFVQFRRSDRALMVLAGFLTSCTVLLAVSVLFFTWSELAWRWSPTPGVPVNDYIAQSGEFMVCAFALAHVALDFFKKGRRGAATAATLLSAGFLLDIFFVATSRTALVIFPVLLVLFGLRHFGWKGVAGVLTVGLALGATVWTSSPYLRGRIVSVPEEIIASEYMRTSSGERLIFWKKSLGFVAEAPLIGHGTGSIAKMFRQTAVGETGAAAEATVNPHNQILGVAIQIGLVGMAVLLAMWLAHLLLFWQPGLFAWVGLVIVVQNVVGSIFNSHLFDFNQGWLYVLGVGVAGGVVLRERELSRPALAPLP